METNIDDIISIMNKVIDIDGYSDLIEQDDGGAASAGDTGEKPLYPTVTKWETGITRGPANQIAANVKWADIVKINRGKANTLL